MYDNPTAWIIPARAGFTRSGPCARCRAGGSSPHTRGLRRPCRRPLPCRGIIPAHAGFTASSVPPGGSWPDHPRTRGVYANRSGSVQVAGGSSPHTRGLHLAASGEHAAERIIPAHAGFTRGPRNRCLRWPDHPRTRGVYLTPSRTVSFRAGSSPHTRGLRTGVGASAVRGRIIPAHAGFTHARSAPGRPGEDHPRTRGVYDGQAPGAGPGVGIIPAHAGFTRRPPPPGPPPSDHPRTRGVYMKNALVTLTPQGSSPHTRGLL